jgi:alkylhydroperoxidase family enzyme
VNAVRIAPLEPPYEPEIEAQLRKWMPPAGAVEPLKLFRTLAIHPDLFARMRPLGAGILGSQVVDPLLREVMIHRTCARCSAEYEWGVHAAAFGSAVGLSDEQLTSTVLGDAADTCWDRRQEAVFRFADELHDTSTVSAALYAELVQFFTSEQILELAITAGWYHTIAYAIGAAGVEHESWALRFPES